MLFVRPLISPEIALAVNTLLEATKWKVMGSNLGRSRKLPLFLITQRNGDVRAVAILIG